VSVDILSHNDVQGILERAIDGEVEPHINFDLF